MKRILRLIAGWTMFALGIVGLVLPILQGWLFLGIAAVLLAQDVPFFKRLLRKVRKANPEIADKAARIVGEPQPAAPDEKPDQ